MCQYANMAMCQLRICITRFCGLSERMMENKRKKRQKHIPQIPRIVALSSWQYNASGAFLRGAVLIAPATATIYAPDGNNRSCCKFPKKVSVLLPESTATLCQKYVQLYSKIQLLSRNENGF